MNLPKSTYSIWVTRLLSDYILLLGVVTIFSLVVARLPHEVTELLPVTLFRLTKSLILIIGLVLVLLSQQLRLRKRNAFFATIITLLVAIGIDLFLIHSFGQALLYMVPFIILLINQHAYTARFSDVDMRRGLWNAFLLLIIGLLYGTVGFFVLRTHLHGHDTDSLLDSFSLAASQILTFSRSVGMPIGRNARWFVDSLQLVSIATAILATSALFRPVRFLFNASQEDISRARAILERWPSSTEDFFKLWPLDKHYFFSSRGQAFLAYKVSRGVAIILDGPSGRPHEFHSVLEDFITFSQENGWRTAVIHANETTSKLLESFGLSTVFIGREAVIEVGPFLSQTIRSKHFRYISNRAEREGLRASMWRQPLKPTQLRILRDISDAWIEAGRSEFTFTMSPFSDEYLSTCDVMVVTQDDLPLAYVNLLPSFVMGERTIDHMRMIPGAPSVTMHYLFLEMLVSLDHEGVQRFNLGLAPLSGIEELEDTTLTEKVLSIAKRIGGRLYSFEGIEGFKRKYEPDWEPRYVAYQGGLVGLLQLGRALPAAMRVESIRLRRISIIGTLGILSGVSYLSFLLAPWLVPHIPSIVSDLGSHGQPYAWIFNGADILSGLLTWIVCYLLLQNRRNSSIWWTSSVATLMLGALGAIMAALIELPNTTVRHHGLLVSDLHNLFSGINMLGIIASTWLLSIYRIRSGQSWKIAGTLGVLFLVFGLFFLNLPGGTILAGEIERVLIWLCAIWLGLFAFVS